MRILMKVQMDTAQFNAQCKSGNAGKTINRILEDCRPEAAYFIEDEGIRTAMLIVNLDDPSQIPRLAEPWFLSFNAKVQFKVAMTPDDLRKAGVDDLGRKWG